MLKIEFSTAEIEALNYERFHHTHPRVQLKMEAVYLKSQQLPHARRRVGLRQAGKGSLAQPLHCPQWPAQDRIV